MNMAAIKYSTTIYSNVIIITIHLSILLFNNIRTNGNTSGLMDVKKTFNKDMRLSIEQIKGVA